MRCSPNLAFAHNMSGSYSSPSPNGQWVRGYLLVTNIVVYWFDTRRPQHKRVVRHIQELPEATPLMISAIILMQIEGGAEDLSQLYGRLLKAGVQIDRTTEHSTTLSVYFFDPDGNRLEIFAEKMSPEEGRKVLRQGGGTNKPLALEPSLA